MGAVYLLIEAALVGAMGLWMLVAVADNWRHPRLNEALVGTVVRFDLMAAQFPDDYALVAHRRIEDPRTISRIFRLIRWTETISALTLLAAAALLVAAAIGVVAAELAVALAALAATGFALIWAGFIIGGNYFAYWYCHPWSQSNHFMLMFWGLFVLAILMI